MSGDPLRISRICLAVRDIWRKHPHLRFFQLLRMIFGSFRVENDAENTTDFFYKEDYEVEQILEEKL